MASFNGEAAPGGGQVLVEVGPDIHICGICKQQFNNFEVFLAHKQNGCHIPSSDTSAPTAVSTVNDSGTEFVFEETYQACVPRGIRKIPTKAQKTPSKKLKPPLTSKRRSCCFSGCSFKTQYGQKDMERHLKTHTGEKPFECEVCCKRFSRRDKLSMHSRSHTGEKPHKCKHCAYAAADSSSLKKHLRIHCDERPFKCQICPYASRNSSQLTVHLRSHTGDAPFQCHQCEAKFKINSDLKRHIRIHSGEKPYKCDFCEYRCAMKGNLKSHVQIRHGTGNSLGCAECDFQCGNKTALRQHSRQHQPAQPIRCPKCSYSCSSKGALKIHERIHSDERPFKCDACGFATKQRSNLVIHRKKFHSDGPEKSGGKGGRGEEAPKPPGSRYRAKLDAARAFRCDACEASFVREDSLRSHRKQHRDVQLTLLQLQVQPRDPPCHLPDLGDLQAPLAPSQLSAYGDAHLKIVVGPQLGQENAFVQAGVDIPHPKGGPVVLSPEGRDVVVGPVLQQVSLLTPVQHQTVLLTHLGPGPGDPLHQALLQTAAVTAQDSGSTQAFITACSDLEGLNALIQEGGTEVTVVTEGGSTGVCSPARDLAKQSAAVPADSAPSHDGALIVPNLSISSQGVVIHGLPLVVPTAQQPTLGRVSPQSLYADAHALGVSIEE